MKHQESAATLETEMLFEPFETVEMEALDFPEMHSMPGRYTSDAVTDYKAHMQRLAPDVLSVEEQAVLAERMVAGRRAGQILAAGTAELHEIAELDQLQADGLAAREKLITANWALGLSRAARRQGAGVEMEDLIQTANSGMCDAADRFEPDKGAKFTSYAAMIIDQRLTDEINNQGRSVRLSEGTEGRLRTITMARAELLLELDREATEAEVAERAGLSVEKMREVQAYARPAMQIDGDPLEFERSMAGNATFDTAEAVCDNLMPEALYSVLDDLSPEQREMIVLQYGLDGREPMSGPQIAAERHMRRARPTHIVREAFEAIRHSKHGSALREYLR